MEKIKVERIINAIDKTDNPSLTQAETELFLEGIFEQEQIRSQVQVEWKPFTFDKKDKDFHLNKANFFKRIYSDFFKRVWIINKTMLKSFVTSGTGIGFLAIMTLIMVLITNNLFGLRIFQDGLGPAPDFDPIYRVESWPNYMQFTSIFITPMILISVLFVPTFVARIRNDSRMKRFGLYGISREQINIGITSTTLFLIFVSIIIIYWPMQWLGKIIFVAIVKNTTVQEAFPYTLNPNWKSLIPLLFLGSIAFTQISIYFGTKFNQQRTTIFFALICMFLFELTSYQLGGIPAPGDYPENLQSLEYIHQMFRWMYILSPQTIILQALALSASTINEGVPGDLLLKNPDWVSWLIPLAMGVATVFSIVPFVTSKRWMKYGGAR